jgi:hypothetical protein
MLEFLGAYTNFYELGTARAIQLPDTSTLGSPDIYELFKPGTMAYKTMAGQHQNLGDTFRNQAIIPILLLNIILFNLRVALPEELAAEYWSLRVKLRRFSVELGSGVAFLSWAIAFNSELTGFRDSVRIDLVARIMSVLVKLSESTRARVQDILLGLVSATAANDAEGWLHPEEVIQLVRQELRSSDLV